MFSSNLIEDCSDGSGNLSKGLLRLVTRRGQRGKGETRSFLAFSTTLNWLFRQTPKCLCYEGYEQASSRLCYVCSSLFSVLQSAHEWRVIRKYLVGLLFFFWRIGAILIIVAIPASELLSAYREKLGLDYASYISLMCFIRGTIILLAFLAIMSIIFNAAYAQLQYRKGKDCPS
jgi:hypothetical protein